MLLMLGTYNLLLPALLGIGGLPSLNSAQSWRQCAGETISPVGMLTARSGFLHASISCIRSCLWRRCACCCSWALRRACYQLGLAWVACHP